MPFGSKDEAYKNADTLGFFSSEQALADYAQIIVDVKKNISAENCPVIAIGASYGGSKLKYTYMIYREIEPSLTFTIFIHFHLPSHICLYHYTWNFIRFMHVVSLMTSEHMWEFP